ncbi:MAG TPA: thiamine pyrophosphate-dependent enzyme [Caulobacteraceae bacterium]|jgi:pyruvate dehydrogenase (quinone)
MSQKVARVIVDTLQAAGVRNCYGIVGDTLNVIAECIHHSNIDWVHMRHEEAGAFAAQAEALLMERLTAMAGTCGPGSLHFINGLYEAYRNRAPVILLATQVVTAELGFHFIQEVDFKSVFQDCSVFCDMIYTPEQALRKTVLACQTAIAKRGPAVLIIPVDIAKAQMHDLTPFKVQASRPVIRPNDAELDQMAALLNQGDRIAIYGGAGCQYARDQILAVADRLQAPIAHTSRAKDFLEYDNPHNIGMTGLLGNEAAYHALRDCDTLLMAGADFAWRQFYPEKATIVQIDHEPTHLGQRHPVSLGVTGDIAPTLEALLPRLTPRLSGKFYEHALQRHRTVITASEAKAAEPGAGGAIPGKLVASVVNRIAADDALFVADDGTPAVWMLRHITSTEKRRTFASLLHGTMASGMASALGLQKAQPGRQVIALCGDGGFSMLLGDLLTAVQEELPIKIAVFDNGKLGFVEIEQKAEGMVNLYTDLKNPDFGAVARAMGLWGAIVENAGELEAGVRAWLAEPGPALLHIKVEPMELVTPPAVEAGPAIGMALYAARAVLQGKGGDVLEMIKENT